MLSSVAAAAVVLSAAAAASCAGNGESSAQAPGISAAAPGVPRPRPAVGLTWRRARKRPMGEPVLGVGRLEEREFGREEGEKKKKRKEAPLTSFPLPPTFRLSIAPETNPSLVVVSCFRDQLREPLEEPKNVDRPARTGRKNPKKQNRKVALQPLCRLPGLQQWHREIDENKKNPSLSFYFSRQEPRIARRMWPQWPSIAAHRERFMNNQSARGTTRRRGGPGAKRGEKQ